MDLKKEIKAEVRSLNKQLVKIRRHLHANPELSFKEKETNKFICEKLDSNEIQYKSGYCKYGIVAEIQGGNEGGLTYLRGDMDALPIKEENKVEYASRKKGIMHACGHDVHTTCVLGTAIVLNRIKKHIPGKYRIIFQPGEEKLPGGASIMIKEGAISNAKTARIFGQHVHPPLETGKVGFYPGQYMASADEIYIEVLGTGGHAALPQDLVDPVVISAHILTGLQSIVSRNADPRVPSVLSFGKINSTGGATNVIPQSVVIEGTFRTMDEENRMKLQKRIRETTSYIARSMGGEARVRIKHGYPTLYNNVELTESAMSWAEEFLGKKNVVLLEKRMTAEDFAYYSQLMPACFYRLGTGNIKKGIISGIHTPTFDIDERALGIGTGLMAWLAVKNNRK